MSPSSRILVTALCMLLPLSLTSPAHSRREAPRVSEGPSGVITLAGVNYVGGMTSGYVRVRVPRQASIDLIVRPARKAGPSRDVDISGRGRFAGVMLTTDPPSQLGAGSVLLISGRFGKCRKGGCDPHGEFVNYQWPVYFPHEAPQRLNIRAGNYRLYLFADGTPVKARLHLSGLRGGTRARMTHQAPVDIETPTEEVAFLDGPSYYSAGAVLESGSNGVALSMLSIEGEADPVDSSFGACAYTGPRPPTLLAYGPHCLALGMGGTFGFWNNDSSFSMVFLQDYNPNTFPDNDGTRGQGVWTHSRNRFDEVYSHFVAIPLGP